MIQRSPAWVLSFAFFPLGLGGFLLGANDVMQGRASRYWNEVPGTVLSSDLATSFLAPRQPRVRYEYTFNNRQYVSMKIWPGNTFGNVPLLRPSLSRAVVDQFPSGAMIRVYVDPQRPERTALIRGPKRALQWMVVFGLFVLVGLGSALKAILKV